MDDTALDRSSLMTSAEIADHVVGGVSDRAHREFEEANLQLALMLSAAEVQFEAGRDSGATIHQLIIRLGDLRARLQPQTWIELTGLARSHEVAKRFMQDPFTRHSREKPRGYSGDAQLLDYIYGHPSIGDEVAQASPMGRQLFAYTSNSPSPAAVRERRDLLATEVDRVAEARGADTEVLAIAAGHLREAHLSKALSNGDIKRWVALDQDPLSIGAMTKEFAGTPVDPLDGSVRGILKNLYSLGTFDLVYAAGLYDYLPRSIAIKLTKKCVGMLKPGGTFLFANFTRDVQDIGYMETFMDWLLLLRDETDMWDIVNASVDRNAFAVDVFRGENGHIVYARLTRRD